MIPPAIRRPRASRQSTTSRCHPSFRQTCLVVLMLATYADTVVLAAPMGGHVVSGTANFQQNGNLTTITAGNRSVINYSSFNIAPNETVRFVQPSATSTVLNRVLDPNPTNIFGQLQSNGIITIANPYGVFFQNGSVINVGGLYAGAGNISTADFTAGRIHFTDLQGDVRNDGVLAAQNQIALMGANVTNNGTMTSTKGLAMMVSGPDVYVGTRSGNIFVQANGAAVSSAAGSITNRGTVAAPRVLMGAGDMYSTAIVNTGLLQGKNITVNAGRNGTATVGGRLDATSASGQGGNIQVQGGTVALQGAKLDASGKKGGGTVRVGGDFHGGGTLAHSTTTTVDAATTIHADATGTKGDGGSVVLWSDGSTRFSGQISARGGARAGDGGQVEVSSHDLLDFGGRVDAGALAGRPGTLLLDPANIIIQKATGPAAPADTSIMTQESLEAMLGLTNVVVTATQDLRVGQLNGNTLTFQAGTGSIQLAANGGGTGTGTFVMQLGDTINTNGRALTISAGTTPGTLNTEPYAIQTGTLNAVATVAGTIIAAGPITLQTTGPSNLAGAITASGLTTTGGGTVNLNGGTVATENVTGTASVGQNYGGPVVLGGTTTLTDTANGPMIFGGAISSFGATPQALTVNTTPASGTAGAITFGGPVGTLASLTTTAGLVNLNGGSVTTTGNQTYGNTVTLGAAGGGPTTLTGATLTSGVLFNGAGTQSLTLNFSNGLSLSGGTAATAGQLTLNNLKNLEIDGAGATLTGNLTTVGSQTYNVPLTLGANVTLQSSGGSAINFAAIDSDTTAARTLTVNTAAATTFNGSVGTSHPLLGLQTTGTGAVNLNGGSVTTAGNGQSYRGAVTLGAPGAATALTDTGGGAIVFQGTLNGATAGTQALTLSTTGAQTFTGAVGTTALASLATGSGAVNLNGGAVTTTGAAGQTYNGPVVLGLTGGTTLSANGGPISFVSTLDGTAAGAQALTLNTTGAQTFAGAVGTTALAGLTTGSGAVNLNGGAVTTTGAAGQTYNGPVSLGATTTLTDTTASPITFSQTVDGTAAGAQALTVVTGGATTFTGAVGQSFALGSLTVGSATVNGGTTLLNSGGVAVATLSNGTATGTGLQTYYNPVRLGQDTTLTSTFTGPATAGGDITFNGTVDSATAAQSALAVNTSGNEIFNGLVGSVNPLRRLETDTSGTVGGQVQFNMSLIGKPAGTAGVSLGTGGALFNDLAIFNVAGSSSAKVPTLISGDAGTNNPSITSTGSQAQSYQGGVTDQQNTVIQGPSILTAGTFDAGTKALTFDLSQQALTVPLTLPGTTFANLASLASVGDAGTTLNGNVTTTGYQYYGSSAATGGVTLANNATLQSSGGGAIGFGGTLNGPYTLEVDTTGSEYFNGLVGNTSPLANLYIDLSTYIGGTANFQMNLTGQPAGTAGVHVTGALSTGDAANFSVTGSASGTSVATSLTSILTGGGQQYNGAATLGQDTVLTDTAATIKLIGAVDGAHNLTLNAPLYSYVQGRVGGTTPLLSLTTNNIYTAGGFVVYVSSGGSVAAPTITTVNDGTGTGAQTYDGYFQTGFDTVLSSAFAGPATAGGTVTFNGKVDGYAGANPSLTVLAGPGQTVFASGATVNAAALNIGGAQVTFNQPVGSSNALNVLTVGRNGMLAGVTPSIDLNGGSITTTLGQTYADGVFLSADATLTDTNAHDIAFNSTVDSLSATVHALTLSTTGAGTITFGGIVGGTHALGALSATTATGGTTFGMTATGTTPGVTAGTVTVMGPVTFDVAGSALARPSILTTGAQSYLGATALEDLDTFLRGTTLTIAGVNGQGHDLTLDFSAGPVMVNNTFTNIRNFASVGAGGTQIGAAGGVTFTTTGTQTYSNATTLTSDATLASGNSDITFASSLGGPFSLVLQPGTGTAFFNGPVGGTSATNLASLLVSGNTSLGGGAVTTVGNQQYAGALTLTNPTTLTSTGSAQVTANSLAGGGNDLTVNATTTSFGAITGGGNLTFNVGAGTGAAFTSTVDALSLKVTGGIAGLSGDVTTNSATLGQSYAQLQLNGNITLRDNASGPISSGAVDGSGAGGQTLAISTGGQIAFNGAVGSALALGSLTTGGGGRTVFNVSGGGTTVTTVANGTTTGAQTYNEAVLLNLPTTLTSLASGPATNAGAILFGGTVDSAATPVSLTVLAGNGQTVFGPGATVDANALNIGGALVTFDAPVGGNGKLDVLTVGRSGAYATGTNTIDLNGGLLVSTLGQTYLDPVILSADTTLKDLNGNNIVFNENSTINGDGVSPRALTLSTTGAVTFGGVIGNVTPLSGLAVTAGSGTTFQMSLAGQPAGTAGVNVGAGGVTINGPTTFAVAGSSLLDLTHVTVQSTGAQAYNGAVALGLDTSFSGTGNISFNGPVNGGFGLAANTSGNVVFGGIVGGSAPLTSLTTDTLIASNGQTQFNANLTGQVAGIAGVRVGSGGLTINNPVSFGVIGSTFSNPSVETFNGGTQTYQGAASLSADTVLVGDASGATPPAGGGYLGGGAIVFGSSVTGTGTPSLSIFTGTGTTLFQGMVSANSLNVTGANVTFGGSVLGLDALFIAPNGAAGGPIMLNGGTSAGYTVRTTAGQTYGSALVLGADAILTNGMANGDLFFASTVDGAHALTLDTGGRIIFNGLVGSTAALTGLTTNTAATPGLGTQFNMNVGGAAAGVLVNGAVVINGPVLFNVGGSSLTQPSVLTLGNHPQTYNGAASLTADTVLVSASALPVGGVFTGGGTISLLSTAGITGTGGSSLSIRAGAGTTTLSGAINVGSVDLGGGSVVISGPITLPGNLSIEPNDAGPANAVQFNGGGLTTAGAQTYNVAILLGADTVLTSLNTAGDGGNIVFASTVDGKFALTLNTSGDEVFNGIVGGNLALTSLTTDATGPVGGAARFNMSLAGAPAGVAGVNVTGAVTINDAVVFNVAGTSLAAGGPASVSTGGAQRYIGAATLLQDTSLTGGNIAFASTVDGAHGLSLTGPGGIVFNGVVGGTDAPTGLTTSGGTTTFNLDLGTAPGAPAAVRVGGALTFGGPVVFNVSGSSSAQPAVLTLGDFAQTYAGAVTLPQSAVLASAGAGVLTFNSTVDGPGALTLQTINQTVFNEAVGGSSPLLAFNGASGPTVINGGTFTTRNAQAYNGPVFIGADTTLTSLDTTGGNGQILFGGTVDGAFALTVSAANQVTFGGPVGLISPLLSLQVLQGPAGTTLINGGGTSGPSTGTITTEGLQTYGGAVVLGFDTILRSLGTAGDAAITFQNKVDGGHALTIDTPGNVSFNGAVGGASPLLSLTTTADGGTTTIAGGQVTTTGAQIYGSAVRLGGAAVLNSLNSAGGGVTFAGTLNGPFALTINTGAPIVFGGAVGTDAGGALASLTTQGSGRTTFRGGQVTTTGAQNYGNPVLLAANGTFSGSGVAFRGTVDGGYILQVQTPGQAFFGGLVGGNTPLAQLTTNAGSTAVFDHSGITTTGLQTYGGTVVLNTDAVLTSKGNKDITFANTVNGRHGLTINTNGNTVFNAAVGNADPLASVTVADGGGTTIFNGPGARTTGFQTYDNAVTLSLAAVSFTSSGNGALTFGKTVDATRAGGTALTLGTTGVSMFNGNVGATNSLASLLVTGPLAIGGERIVTTGDQRYMGQIAANPLTTPDTQLTAVVGNVRFDGTVAAAGSFTVTANRVGAQGDIVSTGNLDLESRNAASPLLLLLGNNYSSLAGTVRFNTQQAYNPAGPNDDNATIILGSGGLVSIRGTSFTMGLNQKVLSLGSLDINVGRGTATVGDLAAKNTLRIEAGEVLLQDREPGYSPSSGGLNNGLNFAAENGISFGGAVIVFAGTGNRQASFVTSNGNVDINRVQGLSLFKDPTLNTQFAAIAPTLDQLADLGLTVYEPVSGGTQSLDTAAALSGALPDQKPVDVAVDITISASQMEELKKLGIHPRLAQRSERGSAASKRALFAQLVDGQDQENYGRLQPIKGGVSRLEPSDFVVVVDRMGEREVQSILSSFEGLYGKNKEKTPEIGAAFQNAFNDYTVAKQTADPAGFADYLQGQKGKYPAVDSAVRGFDDLFGHIEHLGLTNKEVAKSEEHITSDLGVSGVSSEDMVKTINALRKKLPPAQKAASTKAPPSAPAANPAPASALPNPAPAAKPAPAAPAATPSIPEVMPSLPPMPETPAATPPPAPPATPAPTPPPAPMPEATPAPAAANPLSARNTTHQPDRARKISRQGKPSRPAHRVGPTEQ